MLSINVYTVYNIMLEIGIPAILNYYRTQY